MSNTEVEVEAKAELHAMRQKAISTVSPLYPRVLKKFKNSSSIYPYTVGIATNHQLLNILEQR